MPFGGYAANGGFDEGKERGAALARSGKRPKKTVFATDEVAHIWAQQNQDYGRNAKGSVYFNGPTIYSYGSHFPMATFVKTKAGETVVLINSASYSPSTSSHQSSVRQALKPGIKKFSVKRLTAERSPNYTMPGAHQANFEDLVGQFNACLKYASSKRATRRDVDALAHVRESVLDYARAFLDMRKFKHLVPDMPDAATWRAWKAQADEQDIIRDARNLARLDKRREREQKTREAYELEARNAVPDWRAGKNVRISLYHMPTMLRLSADGTEVETSKGASFPAAHAKLAWRIIKRCAIAGETFHTNGKSIHLGSYKIDSIDAQGNITAGCHQISIEEATRCAVLLGLEV